MGEDSVTEGGTTENGADAESISGDVDILVEGLVATTPKEFSTDIEEYPTIELTPELDAAAEIMVEEDNPVSVDTEDGGPVYIDDESVDPVDPIAIGTVSVLANGLTDERLVV